MRVRIPADTTSCCMLDFFFFLRSTVADFCRGKREDVSRFFFTIFFTKIDRVREGMLIQEEVRGLIPRDKRFVPRTRRHDMYNEREKKVLSFVVLL